MRRIEVDKRFGEVNHAVVFFASASARTLPALHLSRDATLDFGPGVRKPLAATITNRARIASHGRSQFIEIMVSETAVRLKQQIGHLTRTDEDHGTATILDRRVVFKCWGNLLMRGMPDFEVIVESTGRRVAAGPRV